MTLPLPTRLVLVSAPPRPDERAKVRRYRLARVDLSSQGGGRFDHLKRVYD